MYVNTDLVNVYKHMLSLLVIGLLVFFLLKMLPGRDEFQDDRDPIVVAVMGPTGTGKSSFIQRLTGAPNIIIGHGLASG